LRMPRFRTFGAYCLSSATLLAIMYIRTNPTMDRYWTHLLPFLVAPAAYALAALWRRRVAAIVITLTATIQIITSFAGLRTEPGNPWFRPGYEALAAQHVNAVIPPGALLIVAQPEPYYFLTGHPVQSISDQPPFLHTLSVAPDRPIYIIEDQAMRQIFPHFSNFLYENLQDHQIRQLEIGTDFRYITQIAPEDKALTIYRVSQSEIRSAFH